MRSRCSGAIPQPVSLHLHHRHRVPQQARHHANLPALRRQGLRGVDEQVGEDLGELHRVAEHPRHLAIVAHEPAPAAQPARGQAQGALQHLVQRQRLQRRGISPGERLEALHDEPHALGALARIRERLQQLALILLGQRQPAQLRPDEAEVAGDERERVVDFMGHSRREPADGGQPLVEPQARLGLAQLGDVAHRDGQAVAHRAHLAPEPAAAQPAQHLLHLLVVALARAPELLAQVWRGDEGGMWELGEQTPLRPASPVAQQRLGERIEVQQAQAPAFRLLEDEERIGPAAGRPEECLALEPGRLAPPVGQQIPRDAEHPHHRPIRPAELSLGGAPLALDSRHPLAHLGGQGVPGEQRPLIELPGAPRLLRGQQLAIRAAEDLLHGQAEVARSSGVDEGVAPLEILGEDRVRQRLGEGEEQLAVGKLWRSGPRLPPRLTQPRRCHFSDKRLVHEATELGIGLPAEKSTPHQSTPLLSGTRRFPCPRGQVGVLVTRESAVAHGWMDCGSRGLRERAETGT